MTRLPSSPLSSSFCDGLSSLRKHTLVFLFKQARMVTDDVRLPAGVRRALQ
jgi:hypothetical protein